MNASKPRNTAKMSEYNIYINALILFTRTHTHTHTMFGFMNENEKLIYGDEKENKKNGIIKLQQGKSIKDGKVTDSHCKDKCGLVKFYMPRCGGCVGMEPTVTFLAKNMKSYDFPICVIDVTDPVNRPIVEAVGEVPYVPYICMFKNDGRIFSIENELGGAHSIHDILPKICEITSGKSTLGSSPKTASKIPKIPKNCSLCCQLTDDEKKITCKKTCN